MFERIVAAIYIFIMILSFLVFIISTTMNICTEADLNLKKYEITEKISNISGFIVLGSAGLLLLGGLVNALIQFIMTVE